MSTEILEEKKRQKILSLVGKGDTEFAILLEGLLAEYSEDNWDNLRLYGLLSFYLDSEEPGLTTENIEQYVPDAAKVFQYYKRVEPNPDALWEIIKQRRS